MTDDRKLLELAAKAVGITFVWINNDGAREDRKPGVIQPYVRWNPLTDDGDALRLAVKLRISIGWEAFGDADVITSCEEESVHESWWTEPYGSDHYAAARRAIVRAAAAIGATK